MKGTKKCKNTFCNISVTTVPSAWRFVFNYRGACLELKANRMWLWNTNRVEGKEPNFKPPTWRSCKITESWTLRDFNELPPFLFEEKKGCDFTAARSEVRRAELLPQSRDGPSWAAKPVMKKQISVAVVWLSAAESASGKKKPQESGERVVGRENWRAGSDTELATWNRMYGHPSSLNKSILQLATNWADYGVTSAALWQQSVDAFHFKTPALFNYWTNCFLFRSATSTFFKPCVSFYLCIIDVIFSRTWRYIYRAASLRSSSDTYRVLCCV